MHGGRIRCDSEVGQGSTFVFALPVRREDDRLQVLVVEDNERNMKLFRDVLQASGYRTSRRRRASAPWSWCSSTA